VQQAFTYRALDKNGSDVLGRVEATGDVEALRLLTAQGLTPLEVRPVRPASRGRVMGRGKLKPTQCAQLLQELSTLLHGGVSLGEALPSLAQAYRATALELPLTSLDKAVRSGRRFSEAVHASGLLLPRYAQPLLEAGEASGQLPGALDDIYRQMAYDESVRSEARQALTYPAVLVVAGIAAVLVVFIGVVPRFAGLLKNNRANVPEVSRWVIEFGMFAREHLLWLGLGATAIAISATIALNRPRVRAGLLEQLARLPLTRNWIMSTEVGRWATLFATLLTNRVPLVDALRLSGDLTALGSLKRQLDDAVREVRRGRPLSAVFAQQGWLDPAQINLIRVGERSGELPRMLRSLGELQTTRSRAQVKRLLSLLEPVAIVSIGVVIGFVMIAVMLAITSLNTSAV
jgi:general secretion pathway protein F